MCKPNTHGIFGMMKHIKLLLLIATVLLASCQKDAPISECSLPYSGLLCKTYIYENDACIGYIAHDYDNTLRKTHDIFKTVKGRTDKTVIYTYTNNRLSEEQHLNASDKETRLIRYAYTDAGLFLKTEYFAGNTPELSHHYTYINNKLSEELIDYVSGNDTLIRYEYDFQGELWRKSYLLNSTSLIKYQIHEFFDNQSERIKFYDARHMYRGYKLIETNTDGSLKSETTYNSENTLTEKTTYNYNHLGITAEKVYDSNMNVKGYKLYYYSE